MKNFAFLALAAGVLLCTSAAPASEDVPPEVVSNIVNMDVTPDSGVRSQKLLVVQKTMDPEIHAVQSQKKVAEADTDVGPVQADTNVGPVSNDTDVGPVSNDTDVGPVSNDTDVGLMSAHHRRLPLQGLTAFQSSTYGSAYASRAIDGNSWTNYHDHSCTHTAENGPAYPWWAVDLGSVKTLYSVSVTNRGDCCSDRLQNVLVGVTNQRPSGNYPLLKHSSVQVCDYHANALGRGETKTFHCWHGAVTGRYLFVQLLEGNMILTLCEVYATELV